MSFRRRLTLLSLLIVGLPLLAVGFLAVRVSGQLQEGRTDAAISQSLHSASSIYESERSQLSASAADLAHQLRSFRAWELRAVALRALLEPQIADGEFRSATVLGFGNEELMRIGRPGGLNAVRISFTNATQGQMRALLLSGISAAGFVERIHGISGNDVAITDDGELIASTLPLDGPPTDKDLEVGGKRLRTGSLDLGSGLELVILKPPVGEGNFLESTPLLAVALAGLLLLAIAGAVGVNRSIHRQLGGVLDAATEIGRGNFEARAPSTGDDELAGVAGEFNRMASMVGEQFHEIEEQRNQLRGSVRRIGQALASGMDRRATLEISLALTVEAIGAAYGHLIPTDTSGELAESRSAGAATLDAEARALLREIEAEATTQTDPVSAGRGQWWAMARVLRGGESGGLVLSVVAEQEPFNTEEQEMFAYLSSQIEASLTNFALYRELERQAVTDELTGLANRRSFNEQLEREIERAGRFHHPLSLVILDIDDFKTINDRCGHAVGDRALQSLAETLEAQTRSLDVVARWGGEEFVVMLPETDLGGAGRLAEKIRAAVANSGFEPPFTISAGVAQLRPRGSAIELLELADQRLYAAKRAGKNRVVAQNHDSAAAAD